MGTKRVINYSVCLTHSPHKPRLHWTGLLVDVIAIEAQTRFKAKGVTSACIQIVRHIEADTLNEGWGEE